MFNLTTKARKLDLPIDIQCELFDQLIMPILLYGCEIWGFQNLDQIERFHRKFLKSLKLNRSTANCWQTKCDSSYRKENDKLLDTYN